LTLSGTFTAANSLSDLSPINGGTVENCFVTGSHVIGTDRVGNIVGYNEGIVRDCVALLNFSNASAGDTNIGRVAGANNGGTLPNNYANSNMFLNGTYRSSDIGGLNGADIVTGNLAAVNTCLAVFVPRSNAPDLSGFLPYPPLTLSVTGPGIILSPVDTTASVTVSVGGLSGSDTAEVTIDYIQGITFNRVDQPRLVA